MSSTADSDLRPKAAAGLWSRRHAIYGQLPLFGSWENFGLCISNQKKNTQTQNGPTLQPCENTSEGIGASSQRGTNASNHSKEDNKDKINTNAAITETCHQINSASIEFSHHINQSKNNR